MAIRFAEEIAANSTPASSIGNFRSRLQFEELEDEEEDDFPLVPCCSALFLLLTAAGLIGTGSLRAFYLKANSAGVPFWLLGGLLLVPFIYYLRKTFRALRGSGGGIKQVRGASIGP